MDPVTHTLVGATLAQAGLKRRTALGTSTLLIGANFPDIDVLAYVWGEATALWFRRGLTHGVLALAVLPLVLAGLIVLWDRAVRARIRPGGPPVVPVQVVLLAAIAIATHPLLDFLNSYGMRWLMPLRASWYYGDTLFIVDPWLWAILAAGLWFARRGASAARLAIVGACAYIAAMATANVAARLVIEREIVAGGGRLERLMVAPLAVTPFTRWVVVDDGRTYRVGMFSWLSGPRLELEELPYGVYRPAGHPEVAAARAGALTPDGRKFLSWARFPYYLVERRPAGERVHIGDARYTLDPERSWAAVTVPLAEASR